MRVSSTDSVSGTVNIPSRMLPSKTGSILLTVICSFRKEELKKEIIYYFIAFKNRESLSSVTSRPILN